MLVTLLLAACTNPGFRLPPSTFAESAVPVKAAPRSTGPTDQPRGMFYVRGSIGQLEVETESLTTPSITSTLDSDAWLGELGFEAIGRTVGGGLRFGGFNSDDDLTATPLTVESTGGGAYFFPHLTIRPGGGRFRIPIRIGPEIRANTVDADGRNNVVSLDATTDALAVGAGFEVEPEFDIIRRNRFALSAYGRLHGGIGAATVNFETATNDTDFDTDATFFGGEAGVRMQLAKFMLSGGFMVHQTVYDVTDTELVGLTPTRLPETTYTYAGVFFAMGIRW